MLAFDFGAKRTGVAVGESLLGQARALTTIIAEGKAQRLSAVAKLIEQWQPRLLVVGLPRSLDGADTEMTARCRGFALQLEGRFALPVALVDERLSSSEAEARLADIGWQARKRHIDAVAAQIILQDYFDAHARARAA